MRILLVNRHYGGTQVPTGRMMQDVADCLVSEGHEVVVLASKGQYVRGQSSSDSGGGVRVHCLWCCGDICQFLSWFLFWIQACISIPFMRWDRCVFLTDPPFLGLVAPFTHSLFGRKRPFFWWTMDLYPESLVAAGMLTADGVLHKLLRFANDVSVRHLSGVICLGERQLQRLETYRNWRAYRGFCLVQPPWDDRIIPQVARAENRFLQQYGLQDKRVALYAGNLGNAHSYEEILDAARDMMCENNLKWVFVFVSRGKRCPNLRAAASDLPNVLVLDYQPPDMTADLLWSADVHIVTLRRGWEGVVVPSKLYGILRTHKPILYIGPQDSDTAREVLAHSAGSVLPNGCGGRCIIKTLHRMAFSGNSQPSETANHGAIRISKYIVSTRVKASGRRPAVAL